LPLRTIGDLKKQCIGLSADLLTEINSVLAGMPDDRGINNPVEFLDSIYRGRERLLSADTSI